MQQYNPFQISQDANNRASKIHMDNMDSGNLDNILSQAMKSNDKDVLQSTIGSLLSKVKDPQRQQMGLNLIQNRMQTIKDKEDEQNKIAGYTQAGLDPSLRYIPEGLQKNISDQNQFDKQYNAFNNGQSGQESTNNNDFSQLSDDQLFALKGHPNKMISNRADGVLKQRDKQYTKDNAPKKYSPQEQVLEKKLGEDIAKMRTSFKEAVSNKSTYNRLDNLINQLSGVTGYTQFLSAEKSELDALGLSAINAPLKMFNPVGAIPTAKIELVRSKFAPQFSDLKDVAKGKVRALRFMNDKALEMGNKLQKLTEKYGNNIPQVEFDRISNEGEQIVDMLSNYDDKKIAKFDGIDNKILSENNADDLKIIDSILEEANGDYKLAEQIAKERGYKF